MNLLPIHGLACCKYFSKIGSVLESSFWFSTKMVKSRDMACKWFQIFKIVCPREDFHAQKEVVHFVCIRNPFYRVDLKRFVPLMQPGKTSKKLKNCGGLDLHIAAGVRNPQNFDKSLSWWMPNIYDEWSILPQGKCFVSRAKTLVSTFLRAVFSFSFALLLSRRSLAFVQHDNVKGYYPCFPTDKNPSIFLTEKVAISM